MADLPTRSAKSAAILGRISLGLNAVSVLVLTIGFHGGPWVAVVVLLLALTGLISGIAGMVLRRRCLDPRPVSPVLGVVVSVAVCCAYAYLIMFLASLGSMH